MKHRLHKTRPGYLEDSRSDRRESEEKRKARRKRLREKGVMVPQRYNEKTKRFEK